MAEKLSSILLIEDKLQEAAVVAEVDLGLAQRGRGQRPLSATAP
ncbi:hypothetical protein ACFQU9_03170 [Actinomadura namibiensis]|uniref:Uncharacterized protein n=1 Tax=Actinomadura namibiensis TaxID=182080 RepID=A0A7W3QSW0_ACTNM|nr:hypothetical protein [Actinomadura namibiensis]MBA8957763.1 hypothetical protein [Actinomadura namibiensis]